MRRILALAVLAWLLAGCAISGADRTPLSLPAVIGTSVPTGAPAPAETITPRIPALQATETADAPEIQATLTAAVNLSAIPKPDLTATQACGEDGVCYLNGHFLLQNPIPLSGNQSIDQTYRYGTTQDGKREAHHGVEFPNDQGVPVLAAANGVVIFAGNDKLTLLAWVTGFYGNVVVLQHDLPGFGTVYTLYGHLFKIDVQSGQKVAAGDKIGEVGATGTAIGNHLHFEVRLGKNDYKSNRNPELWLKPLPGTGVLAGRIVDLNGIPPKGLVNIQRLEDGVILKTPIVLAETYTRENMISVQGDDAWQENFVVGELPAGDYRLTLVYNGKMYEQRVKIGNGKLTLVIFNVE